jgi:hypothetical protein
MLSAIDSSKMSLWSRVSALFHYSDNTESDGRDTAVNSADQEVIFDFGRNGGDSHINDSNSDAGSAVFHYESEHDEDEQDEVTEWLALENSSEWQKEKPTYTLVRYFPE